MNGWMVGWLVRCIVGGTVERFPQPYKDVELVGWLVGCLVGRLPWRRCPPRPPCCSWAASGGSAELCCVSPAANQNPVSEQTAGPIESHQRSPAANQEAACRHLLGQDVDVVSHLPRRHLHLHLLLLTLALLLVRLLDHIHLQTRSVRLGRVRTGSEPGSGPHQLPRSQVEQDPLGVLVVMTTLH